MSLQAFLAKVIIFINEAVIPFILAIAFVIFLFNVARYFIIQEEKRDEAKRTALWGILAFVVIASIWGITNLLVNGLDLRNEYAPCPDYNPLCQSKLDNPPKNGSGYKNWNPNDREPTCIWGISCQIENGVRKCSFCIINSNPAPTLNEPF